MIHPKIVVVNVLKAVTTTIKMFNNLGDAFYQTLYNHLQVTDYLKLVYDIVTIS